MRHRFFQVYILFVFFTGFIPAYNQGLDVNKKICLNTSQAKAREIIYELEKKSGYRFAFQSSLLQNDILITLNSCDLTIAEIVQKIFANENLDLILTGKQVIVIKPVLRNKKENISSKVLIKKEIEDIENILIKDGELAVDTIRKKYPELVEINRISVSSITGKHLADTNLKITEKSMIRVDYDTNTFIIYDTIRTKYSKIVKLGLSKITSINWTSNLKTEKTIVSRNSYNDFKLKKGLFNARLRLKRSSSVLRRKNDHLDPYIEKHSRYNLLNTNYLIGIEAGINNPIKYNTNNYRIPTNFSSSGIEIGANKYFGFKLMFDEGNFETEIGFRYQRLDKYISGFNYTQFIDSSNIVDRNLYYTYNVFPVDTYYKYFPGRDTVWITIYDSVRISHEILTYGLDSVKNVYKSTLINKHFEIPVGVGYHFNIYNNIWIKPKISFIYSYTKTKIEASNNLEDWNLVLTDKVFSSLLASFDLSIGYTFKDKIALYANIYTSNSIYSFNSEQNWNYYRSFGGGIGITYKIRSKKR
jgi:hypothetical protein